MNKKIKLQILYKSKDGRVHIEVDGYQVGEHFACWDVRQSPDALPSWHRQYNLTHIPTGWWIPTGSFEKKYMEGYAQELEKLEGIDWSRSDTQAYEKLFADRELHAQFMQALGYDL